MKSGKYILVKAPEDYPGKKYGKKKHKKYCYEHHLVWWREYGCLPSKGECLHHINNDPHDNRIENLQLKLWRVHTKDHNVQRPRVEPIKCICEFCRKEYFIKLWKYRHKKKRGQRFFCSRRCIGKAVGGGRNRKINKKELC